VLRRPLALVTLVLVGDYLLWKWSLGGGRSLLAIVTGLALVPLTIVLLWLLAVSFVRLTSRAVARTVGSQRGARRADAAAMPVAAVRRKRDAAPVLGGEQPADPERLAA
jgi:hypothetical protein